MGANFPYPKIVIATGSIAPSWGKPHILQINCQQQDIFQITYFVILQRKKERVFLWGQTLHIPKPSNNSYRQYCTQMGKTTYIADKLPLVVNYSNCLFCISVGGQKKGFFYGSKLSIPQNRLLIATGSIALSWENHINCR